MLTDEERRRDFPVLDGMIYLNTAAEGIPPLCVGEALQSYWRDKQRGMKGREAHFARLEECRKTAARALRLSASEVSFCSCSAEAYNLLASALDLRESDEVVISNLDFPSGATPWLCARTGLKVNLWKAREGALILEDLIALLNQKTQLVQVSLVSFYNGFRLAWRPFIKSVRKYAPNALVSVDVTQALGRVVLDCSDADCIVSSTHKWILGTHGGCIVGIPERSAQRLTARAGGWFHIENAFEPDRFERVIRKAGAASFSVGMPNFAAIYALTSSLRYLEALSIEKIDAYTQPLVDLIHDGLVALGIKPMAPHDPANRSGIVSFQHPQSGAIHGVLEDANIHVMHHTGRIRIAVHGYNRPGEIKVFLETLGKARQRLAGPASR